MRRKSLLTYWSASMCSTKQSPRAENAFSSACAARTCPAPDVAENSKTRGFVFIYEDFPGTRYASRSLALSGGELFENASRDFLDFSETRQVVLKVMVQELRVLRAELVAENHVAQFHRVGKQRLFLQFLQRNLDVVVVHVIPQQESFFPRIVLISRSAA